MVKIKIIRHSERMDYTYPVYWMFCVGQYWADSPLTKNGYRIAYEKGKTIAENNTDIKYIYTSPYSRTMATAMEIKKSLPKAEIRIEPLLAEYQPRNKHTINLYPDGIPTTYEGSETEFVYPETPELFAKRVDFILTKLIEKHNDDFIIITHGEILKVFINTLQSQFPDTIVDAGCVPYLTTVSFEYDKKNNKILEKSIQVEQND